MLHSKWGWTKTGDGPPGISSEALVDNTHSSSNHRWSTRPGHCHQGVCTTQASKEHVCSQWCQVPKNSLWCKLVTTTTLRPCLGLSQESLNRRWGTDDAVGAFILWPHPGNPVLLDGINLLIKSSRVLKDWLTYQILGSIQQQVMKSTSRKWCNKFTGNVLGSTSVTFWIKPTTSITSTSSSAAVQMWFTTK